MKELIAVITVFVGCFLFASGIVFIYVEEYVLSVLTGIGFITYIWLVVRINKDNDYQLFK